MRERVRVEWSSSTITSEEQFAQLELVDQEKLKEAEAQKESNAAERELDEMDKAIQSETNEFGDFESIWKGIKLRRMPIDLWSTKNLTNSIPSGTTT